MKLIECQQCGSSELQEVNGVLVCEYCRSQFVPQTDDLPPVESSIELDSDVAALLKKCEVDPGNRRRYASLILDIDPTNSEALKYLR